jgi:hypothetical protein
MFRVRRGPALLRRSSILDPSLLCRTLIFAALVTATLRIVEQERERRQRHRDPEQLKPVPQRLSGAMLSAGPRSRSCG